MDAMNRARSLGCRTMQALAVLAMCLRVAVPAGYMPGSVADDGWYLQWCPDGVAVEVLEILFDGAGAGDSGAHAHHHGGGISSASAVDDPADADASYAQCDLSGFSADAHHAQRLAFGPAPASTPFLHALRVTRPSVARLRTYHSRAPPVGLI
ncbi:MAG: hypothetical protein AAGA68_11325 [Pseudomonadota bacterium]